ncbi:hypothetical protein FRC12_019195, partial [Ceratobasidium sp. 428]
NVGDAAHNVRRSRQLAKPDLQDPAALGSAIATRDSGVDIQPLSAAGSTVEEDNPVLRNRTVPQLAVSTGFKRSLRSNLVRYVDPPQLYQHLLTPLPVVAAHRHRSLRGPPVASKVG